ncbi:MAG: proline--tRNA ligase, partial [Actinobacteria bacterium]
HLRGVDVERDIAVTDWMDLRIARAGEPCPECGEPLEVFRAIEVGHIFKLGTVHSVALGVNVQNAAGEQVPIIMGSYGIGVERNMAAVVEVHHDDKGIVWPVSVAPYEVVVTVLSIEDETTVAEGERIYRELGAAGIDVIIDDRDARPGVKFTDAELIGIPYRVTVGPRGLARGMTELTVRRSGETSEVAVGDVAGRVVSLVLAERLAGS